MIGLTAHQPVDTAPPTRSGPALTAKHSTAGLRWLFERRERWGLTMDELGTLLGGIRRRTLTEWQKRVNSGGDVEVTRDTMERISLLLGIHKALALITPSGHENLAFEWFQAPIDLMGLQGQSIRDYLLEQGSMDALYYVRRNLDAMRG
ncbi:MAG TPA: helix-turn-helix transcriptional regulator [Marinobacter sp.]|uniref:helix-turn-helix domain-containing protein n=1 Tax=Marinobacter sp. TaxID=50741 RepID=UPI00263227B0|nr:helix-turn-helix transcriptional regulator [Marinobacter sp.]HET8800688.1 helix-turn-helix transcriptional regulator [Marinobacter sp.]